MPLSAWLMLIFGCTILYGGLALCITIAARNRNQKTKDQPPPLTQPNPEAEQ